jgi:GT2 family glycosyltransferase
MKISQIPRSFIIPVLDLSPHSSYNIKTLLDDLEDIPGEVICVFNSRDVYEELHSHRRIDKYCFNNLNAGVSRSWNIGINMAEGRTVFIMNADLHIKRSAVELLETYLSTLHKAVIVGPQGSLIDHQNLSVSKYFEKGMFNAPVQTHDVSGFLFAIDLERFLQHRLTFDVRFSPCFFEEWDMGLQVLRAGLACYAVPVVDFEHEWGVSKAPGDLRINYFGKVLQRNDILLENRRKFRAKWQSQVSMEGTDSS